MEEVIKQAYIKLNALERPSEPYEAYRNDEDSYIPLALEPVGMALCGAEDLPEPL
jgi:hypothetical protein|nr:MAG TPA: hypothetical protein [Caudoviricetes sp.]